MTEPLRYAISWSGGKDSMLAAWRLWQQHGPPAALVTTLSEDGARSRAHWLRPAVLRAQAGLLDLPLHTVATSLPDYRRNFSHSLAQLRDVQGISAAVFGDIALEAHRSWFRAVCAELDLDCLHPLWEEAREALLAEFLAAGFVTRLVAVQADKLSPQLLGRVLDADLLDEFRAAGIDLCGENGEYHTLVVDGPCFREPLRVREAGRGEADGYSCVDFVLS